MRPILRSLVVFALTGVLAACGSPPPPEVPAEPKTAWTDAPAPKKKPKKKPCKSLDEECEAKASTRARIPGADLVFHPGNGWFYAQTEEGTVAQASEDGPALLVATYEVGDAKKEVANREAALAQLAELLKVSLPKKKVGWKKPDDKKDVGELKLQLWQVEGGARGEKKGPLLIFLSALEDGRALLGLGFVPNDDSSGADASILESIESIESTAPVEEDEENDK